jgi:hypothetical protein
MPLRNTEALEILSAAGMAPAAAASAIRELAQSGVVQPVHGGGVRIHDAFRLLARDSRTAQDPATVNDARDALVTMLQRTLPTHWTVGRFGLWIRLLPQTGRTGTLIDIATHEQFHQVGDPSEVKASLESIALSADSADEDRFWALDALFLWDYTEGIHDRLGDLVDRMAAVEMRETRAAAGFAMKQMITAALRGSRADVDAAYSAVMPQVESDPSLAQIVRHNHALALFHLGAYGDAASGAFALVMDYYEHLGLELEDVVRTTPAHILSAVAETPERDDDLRRTADCLNLLAAAHQRLGQPSAMAYLHALKFYTAASASRSAVRAGQDAAHELVGLGQPEDARDIIEHHLLPMVTQYQLSDLLVPVRAQYAVVLAWCGDVDAAREEMSRLEAYQVTGVGAMEIASQRVLIEKIAAGEVSALDA